MNIAKENKKLVVLEIGAGTIVPTVTPISVKVERLFRVLEENFVKLRRVRTAAGLEVQTNDASGSWQPCDDSSSLGGRTFDREWELTRADEHLTVGGPRVNGWMSAKACGETVRDWSKSLEKDQLKMVFLQQCGRGSVENLYNFRDASEVVLSSQLVVGAPNTYYTAVIKKACVSPRMTGEKLAKLIMTEDLHYTNYVLVDGDAISDFPKKVEPLLKALLKKTDSFSLPRDCN